MARIAAVHALGDIWAMGAQPQAALAQIILPRMSPDLQARTMDEVMNAAHAVFTAAGATIVGGHSSMGSELTIGFTVTGIAASPPIAVDGARPGDFLILTRPIGSGTILAADMMGQANGRHVADMLAQMAKPQDDAARILQDVHAMTDVTGFGLAGHLMAICRASGLSATVTLDSVPIYPGAEDLAEQGHHSTLFRANSDSAPAFGADTPKARLLYDPQTAGGLLATVAPELGKGLVARLREAGHQAAVIGHMQDGPAGITLQ
jgi:selenide,water dikinase